MERSETQVDTSDSQVRGPKVESLATAADESTPLLPGKTGLSQVAREESVLERGVVRFFYRPHMQSEDSAQLDLQRLFILMLPGAARPDDAARSFQKKRLLVVGRRTLQVSTEATRQSLPRSATWCMIDVVSNEPSEIARVTGEQEYLSPAPGSRPHASAVPCGSGVYALVRFQGHTFLVYRLTEPERHRHEQQDFTIEQEGSYQLAVKNPVYPDSSTDVRLPRSRFPPELQELIGERKQAPVLDSRFLDYVGAELVMLGVTRGQEQDETPFDQRPEVDKYLQEEIFDVSQQPSLVPPSLPLGGAGVPA
jgi:hypothetical protein